MEEDPRAIKPSVTVVEEIPATPTVSESSIPTNQIPDVTSPPSMQPIHKKTPRILMAAIILILVIVLGLIGWYVYKLNKNTVLSSVVTGSKTTTISTNSKSDTYYSTPKKLSDLGLITNTVPVYGFDSSCTDSSGNAIAGCKTPDVALNSITYTQVGTTLQKQPIIVATITLQGVGSYYQYYIFVETSPLKYTFYGNMYDQWYVSKDQIPTTIKEFNSTFSSQVTVDTTSTISSLTFPQTVVINNSIYMLPPNAINGSFISSINYINQYGASTTPIPSADITRIGQVGNVTFYDVIAQDANYYQIHEIYGVIGSYVTEYVQYDTMTAGKGLITFSQSMISIASSQMMSAQTGCGNDNAYVTAKGLDPTTLVEVGTGPSNQTIYELPNNSPFLSYIYKTDYQGGQAGLASTYQNLTLAQLQTDGGVLVVKNNLLQYQVYFRNDIFTQGGCGKPVIYLYPTKTESVSVRVGANIEKSSPNYGINGWSNVIAQPNGQLTYDNNSYSSLYWEGTGKGIYPEITSGTIVKTSDAISTIRTQLYKQGLNSKEITDFLSYWSPKLPNTPYIRLTWFDTKQMNQLAPLFISPIPQTLIRVFLDFQGLNEPYALTKQTFITPSRSGFTVVEWGGLLKNGSQVN
jgi:hypothetical protein